MLMQSAGIWKHWFILSLDLVFLSLSKTDQESLGISLSIKIYTDRGCWLRQAGHTARIYRWYSRNNACVSGALFLLGIWKIFIGNQKIGYLDQHSYSHVDKETVLYETNVGDFFPLRMNAKNPQFFIVWNNLLLYKQKTIFEIQFLLYVQPYNIENTTANVHKKIIRKKNHSWTFTHSYL